MSREAEIRSVQEVSDRGYPEYEVVIRMWEPPAINRSYWLNDGRRRCECGTLIPEEVQNGDAREVNEFWNAHRNCG